MYVKLDFLLYIKYAYPTKSQHNSVKMAWNITYVVLKFLENKINSELEIKYKSQYMFFCDKGSKAGMAWT
jgi:hypothetical protein